MTTKTQRRGPTKELYESRTAWMWVNGKWRVVLVMVARKAEDDPSIGEDWCDAPAIKEDWYDEPFYGRDFEPDDHGWK